MLFILNDYMQILSQIIWICNCVQNFMCDFVLPKPIYDYLTSIPYAKIEVVHTNYIKIRMHKSWCVIHRINNTYLSNSP